MQIMYKATISRVRVNSDIREELSIWLSIHYGLVLVSHFFLIIVLKVMIREFKTCCLEELLYADGLVLTHESIKELRKEI